MRVCIRKQHHGLRVIPSHGINFDARGVIWAARVPQFCAFPDGNYKHLWQFLQAAVWCLCLFHFAGFELMVGSTGCKPGVR